MPRLAHGPEVRDAQQRIAWRLDPEQVRMRPRNRLLDVSRSEVGELQFELVACGKRAQEAIGATVAIVRRKHLPSRRNELERERDSGHAGTGDDTTRAL